MPNTRNIIITFLTRVHTSDYTSSTVEQVDIVYPATRRGAQHAGATYHAYTNGGGGVLQPIGGITVTTNTNVNLTPLFTRAAQKEDLLDLIEAEVQKTHAKQPRII